MVSETSAPLHPIEIRISIGAEDWDYVRRRLTEWLQDMDHHGTLGQQITGGAGGSASVTVAFRDVSIEQFRKELDDWFEREKK